MKNHEWLSERMVFGLLIFVGYFVVAGLSVVLPLSDGQRQSAKDSLILVGPLLGVIVNSIWKTDRIDRVNADTANKQAETIATIAPIAAAATPPSAEPQPVVVTNAAENPVQVTEAT
jgi:hypothetical protein